MRVWLKQASLTSLNSSSLIPVLSSVALAFSKSCRMLLISFAETKKGGMEQKKVSQEGGGLNGKQRRMNRYNEWIEPAVGSLCSLLDPFCSEDMLKKCNVAAPKG